MTTVNIKLSDTMTADEVEQNIQMLRSVWLPSDKESEQAINEFLHTVRTALIDKDTAALIQLRKFFDIARIEKELQNK